ncbi:MAG: NAD(P)-binding protein [Woeseiaceae bacterium]
MKSKDRHYGMDREISRRDVLHGVGAVAAASFLPSQAFADQMLALEKAGVYPPALTGMRGNHPGSFDAAHQLAREGRVDWGPYSEPDADVYDLVVVGGGISGLAAAHFYRKSHPGARILILDNHDDFGGHAKRNEFDVDGHTVIGYGGSQTLENPSWYNESTKILLDDLGVDLSRFESAFDQGFYKRNGLGASVFFDKESWGENRLVNCDLGSLRNYIPFAPPSLSTAEAVEQMPMSDAAKVEMLHLLTTTDDHMPDVPLEEKEDYLYGISYRDFLSKHLGITEPEVFAAMQNLATDSSLGIDKATAGDSLVYVGLPGRDATGIPAYKSEDPYIHHFPDGNASIARLLVRSMIPESAPGNTMEDIVTARFDYSKLDVACSPVRLRLNSTVVHVENNSGPKAATQVNVTYVQNGQSCRVKAKNCVLACYNAMIPSMCPELPEEQREALAWQVKTPMLYTTVALRNWRAWKNLGIGGVVVPNGYHVNAMLDFPVSMGDYKFGDDPDDPILVHMERFFYRANQGLSQREQHRLGRHDLYATSFETIESNIRAQLDDILADGGFDAARDIAGITVNRWAHGYSYGYNDLDDWTYDDRNDERYPHVRGRKTFGRIAIANSDAGAGAIIHVAIAQAYRAVSELD